MKFSAYSRIKCDEDEIVDAVVLCISATPVGCKVNKIEVQWDYDKQKHIVLAEYIDIK